MVELLIHKIATNFKISNRFLKTLISCCLWYIKHDYDFTYATNECGKNKKEGICNVLYKLDVQ